MCTIYVYIFTFTIVFFSVTGIRYQVATSQKPELQSPRDLLFLHINVHGVQASVCCDVPPRESYNLCK
jgi:hypothetical protein